ncbi:hypothetical protein [Longimicrobium sp.]|uniref:hypothetical protein n=1 Tax=Longimicrobium sp. TaxID=2029185 RepID=UPI002E31D67F|nr:hypothetical protein [Longimicrobium sp.]HEX6041286.1 hypothetical protein [Longimicrobium sp.]
MADEQDTTGPTEPGGSADEVYEPLPDMVHVTNAYHDRDFVQQINKSGQRLRKATERVAQVLADSPALSTTERSVSLRRTEAEPRDIDVLWYAIDAHSEALSFPNYARFLRTVCEPVPSDRDALLTPDQRKELALCRHVPGADLYPYLKSATEIFLLLNCGVCPFPSGTKGADARFGMELNERGFGQIEAPAGLSYQEAQDKLSSFLGHAGNNYLEMVIRTAFPGGKVAVQDRFCLALENEQLDAPCLLELIWSYWMEEGMLNQTIAAITRRFQNVRRAGPGPDPLAELELDPLRPLSGFIWGWLQDEPSRLSVVRRAYEYNHHYGLTLYGRAVPPLRAADPRSRFLEGFHNLLRQASAFYREDNDTTVIADPFPVLNSLREVHLLLSEGAHNQFRDLPWQSRGEMMMQQWLISRPEMREFLRGRHMTAYPEEWMGGVDAMKRLQGWTDTSVRYFSDLAQSGERILLSIRYGPWNNAGQEDARSWLRYWREDVQRYIHAYQTATGVGLGDDVAEVRNRTDARYLQPSYHLRNRLLSARRAAGAIR